MWRPWQLVVIGDDSLNHGCRTIRTTHGKRSVEERLGLGLREDNPQNPQRKSWQLLGRNNHICAGISQRSMAATSLRRFPEETGMK
jgi:hypothetical protein